MSEFSFFRLRTSRRAIESSHKVAADGVGVFRIKLVLKSHTKIGKVYNVSFPFSTLVDEAYPPSKISGCSNESWFGENLVQAYA